MFLGVFVGSYFPVFGVGLKPLGDGFIKLIKMVVAPIIFTTVVVGMAGIGSFKRVGRVGAKALLYFEIMTTLALVIGYVVVKWLKPGVGIRNDHQTSTARRVWSNRLHHREFWNQIYYSTTRADGVRLHDIVLLGGLLKFYGINIWKFLKFIREEIFIVLGTASSESVLPRMMTRLEQLGCSKPIVGWCCPRVIRSTWMAPASI